MPSLNVFWRAIVSARHQLILSLFVYRHCDGNFRFANVFDRGAGVRLYNAQRLGLLGHRDHHHRWLVAISTPHTPLGRILASILILIGYSIIAIPTGLITTHMTSALNRRRQRRLCPQCQQGDP